MTLSKKLKSLLRSNPSTIGLIKYLENLEASVGNSDGNVVVPTKTSDLVNDSGFLTEDDEFINGLIERVEALEAKD